MKNTLLKIAVSTLLIGSSMAAHAELTANFSAASTYLWRGTSLSVNGPQVAGGIDYSNASGLYAGFWQSSEGAANSTETDLYFGFSGAAGDIGYDIGYVSYMYLQNDSADFDEVYVKASFENFSAGYAIDSGNDATYLNLGADFGKVSVTFGSYDFDAGGDYTHFDVAYDIGNDVAITYSKTDMTGDDGKFVISWGMGWDVK